MARADREDVRSWIDDARSGSAEALDSLYRHFEGPVAAYVSRRMGARAKRWVEAQDVVQRALLETLQSLKSLPAGAGEDELRRRLFRTARTRILDVVRAREREAGESALLSLESALGTGPSTGTVTREDSLQRLRELVEELPETYRAVVAACGLNGSSYEEAGRTLGLSSEAARKRFERGREMLVRKLAADEP